MVRVLGDAAIFRFLPDDPPSLDRLRRQYAFLEGGLSPDGAERWLTWILRPHSSGNPIGFVQATIR
jgi:hypothetical protein